MPLMCGCGVLSTYSTSKGKRVCAGHARCLLGCTIYVRFNVPPLFIVPPPIGREHVPRGSVPPSRLAGGWYPKVRRTLTPPLAQSAYKARNFFLAQSSLLATALARAHAGSPLRAPGGARRKRVVELRRVHALHEPAPEAERGGSPLLGRLGPVVRLAEHGHKHKGHGDCTPFMGACGCTPIPEVYPPPQVVPPPLEQEHHRLH